MLWEGVFTLTAKAVYVLSWSSVSQLEVVTQSAAWPEPGCIVSRLSQRQSVDLSVTPWPEPRLRGSVTLSQSVTLLTVRGGMRG